MIFYYMSRIFLYISSNYLMGTIDDNSRNGEDGGTQTLLHRMRTHRTVELEYTNREETVDMRDYHSTWSVQGDLLIMQMDGSPSIIFRFSHKDGTLLIYDPYISGRFGESATDVKLEDANVLVPYGLSALEEYFKVEQLDGDDMRLESSTVRLVFRKY